jgi:hypothetical protein
MSMKRQSDELTQWANQPAPPPAPESHPDYPPVTRIEPTEFFDPATYEFNTFGMAEELIDVETSKVVGVRRVPKANRPIGSEGNIIFTITASIPVMRGHKSAILKASPTRPITVRASLFPLCGHKK